MIDLMKEFVLNFDISKLEDKYVQFSNKIRGLVGPATVNILSEMVSLIKDKERNCYLEIGTFQGMSLIGAGLYNKDVRCYGVDNFSEDIDRINWEKTFDSNQRLLDKHLKHFCATNCEYFDTNYVKFFDGRKDVNEQKVEVYLADGPHQTQHQIDMVLNVRPMLADRAIVVIDDYSSPAVKEALDVILREKQFSLVRIFDGQAEYPLFREGIAILEFNR